MSDDAQADHRAGQLLEGRWGGSVVLLVRKAQPGHWLCYALLGDHAIAEGALLPLSEAALEYYFAELLA